MEQALPTVVRKTGTMMPKLTTSTISRCINFFRPLAAYAAPYAATVKASSLIAASHKSSQVMVDSIAKDLIALCDGSEAQALIANAKIDVSTDLYFLQVVLKDWHCFGPKQLSSAMDYAWMTGASEGAKYAAISYPILFAAESLLTAVKNKLPSEKLKKIDELIANNVNPAGPLYYQLLKIIVIFYAVNLALYRAHQLNDNSKYGNCNLRPPDPSTWRCEAEFLNTYLKGLIEGLVTAGVLGIIPKLKIVSSCLGSIVSSCKKFLGLDNVVGEENTPKVSSSYFC